MYWRAPLSGKVSHSRNLPLYWVALHHLAHFMFADMCALPIPAEAELEAKVAEDHRQHLVRRLLTATPEDMFMDLLLYKPDCAFPPDHGEQPEASRLALLRSVAAANPQLLALAAHRHPSFF